MHGITDADRVAAETLRAVLADLSGFWFRPGDEGPLVAALARHRAEAEQRLADKLSPFLQDAPAAEHERERRPAFERELPSALDPRKLWGPFAL